MHKEGSDNHHAKRRSAKRTKVVMRAEISLRGKLGFTDCLIRDASATGCRIVSSMISDIPDDVYLKFRNIDGPIAGRIVWRQGKEAGIEFARREAKNDAGQT